MDYEPQVWPDWVQTHNLEIMDRNFMSLRCSSFRQEDRAVDVCYQLSMIIAMILVLRQMCEYEPNVIVIW